MDMVLANALKFCRDQYHYPWARIRLVDAGPVRICPGFAGDFDDRAPRVTDIQLDLLQVRLLMARHACRVHAGSASVIYWGFRTFGRSDTFAQKRALRYLRANTARRADSAIQHAKIQCNSHAWGAALGSIGTLNQLGKMPFATKVIAFLDPENAGVYDNKINRLLASGLAQPMLGCPAVPMDKKQNMVNSRAARPVIQGVYQQWCERLRQLRDDLNAIGTAYRWTCTESRPHAWRAVDVERSIFQLADFLLPPKNPRTCSSRERQRQNARSAHADDVRPSPLIDRDLFDLRDIRRRLRGHCRDHPLG